MTARPNLPAVLVAVVALVPWAATSRAAEIDPRFSTIDPVVVGNPLGIAMGGAPAGYDVVLRDINMEPRPGAVVSLRFPATMKVHTTQNAGTTVDCAQRMLSRVTDGQGHVNFAARVGGWVNTNAVEVINDGVVLGSVKGRSLDYDGDGRVSLVDFAIFSEDFANAASSEKSDFDLSGGNTGIGDFDLFRQVFGVVTTPPEMCL